MQIKKIAIFALIGVLLAHFAWAQSPPSSCPSNSPVGCGGGGGSGGGGGRYTGWTLDGFLDSLFKKSNRNTGPTPSEISYQLNEQGNKAYDAGDYAAAAELYKQSLKYEYDPTVSENLQAAQDQLKQQDDSKKAASDRQAQEMRDKLQEMRDKLSQLSAAIRTQLATSTLEGNSLSAIAGLDFLPADNASTPAQGKQALIPVEPPVVDARDVPTGLPKSVEEQIPHTPAGDRERKGLEAIMDHDWKVALVWFQDAANHDPSDPGLKRLVDLAQFTLDAQTKKLAAPSAEISASNVVHEQMAVLEQTGKKLPTDMEHRKELLDYIAVEMKAPKLTEGETKNLVTHLQELSKDLERETLQRMNEVLRSKNFDDLDDITRDKKIIEAGSGFDRADFLRLYATKIEQCHCTDPPEGKLQLPEPKDSELLFDAPKPGNNPIHN